MKGALLDDDDDDDDVPHSGVIRIIWNSDPECDLRVSTKDAQTAGHICVQAEDEQASDLIIKPPQRVTSFLIICSIS